MTDTISIKLQPQFVAYTDFEVRGIRLHKTQQLFYNFDKLHEINIIVAPTGTGKSFAFPLPIIQAKESSSPFTIRKGIIIAPTNALIEDMQRQFLKHFSEIKVSVLNSLILDEKDTHGVERWKEIQRIINDSDIIITNPDLLNFAIMGGYANYVKGQRIWIEVFLERFDYFVFDEYHLYDEEQIANILSLVLIRQKLMPHFKSKFIFTSATPEKGLEEFFLAHSIPYQFFQEELSNKEAISRAIHGELVINFLNSSNVMEYISQDKAVIEKAVFERKRVLIIFDKLKELQKTKSLLKKCFPSLKIAEDSGYMTHAQQKDDTKTANIILGTNKIEVGVNIDVDTCFMQPGKYFQNFLQRFGRVARGKNSGEVFIFSDGLKKIREMFKENEQYDYYSFVHLYSEITEQRKFYAEKIPPYIGAFLFAIQYHTNNWELKQHLREKIGLEGLAKSSYFAMVTVDEKIRRLSEINSRLGKGYTYDLIRWQEWWKSFLETFRYFRPQTINVNIKDLDYGDDWTNIYSLEWILKNKNIINKETSNGNEYYVVAGLREEKQPFAYVVTTLPVGELTGNQILMQNRKYELKKAFIKTLSEAEQKYKGRFDEFSQKCLELCKDIGRLSTIFTAKRLLVQEIIICENIF